jgi:hypothetical protein
MERIYIDLSLPRSEICDRVIQALAEHAAVYLHEGRLVRKTGDAMRVLTVYSLQDVASEVATFTQRATPEGGACFTVALPADAARSILERLEYPGIKQLQVSETTTKTRKSRVRTTSVKRKTVRPVEDVRRREPA